jgi:uncharacterized protein
LTAGATAPAADPRRRRVAVGGTLPVGAVLLALAFTESPGSTSFYLLTLAVAAVWAVGGILSGPVPLGPVRTCNGWYPTGAASVAIGVVAAGAVVASVLLGRQVPGLRGFLDDLLARARGPAVPTALVTLVNGAAEEQFFRGAVYAAVGPRLPVLMSTAVYALATAATGNPALVVAAVALGAVFGLQRRNSGGILTPALTHLTWSAVLLAVLPRLPN